MQKLSFKNRDWAVAEHPHFPNNFDIIVLC